MITAKRTDKTVTRNSSFFRPYISDSIEFEEENCLQTLLLFVNEQHVSPFSSDEEHSVHNLLIHYKTKTLPMNQKHNNKTMSTSKIKLQQRSIFLSWRLIAHADLFIFWQLIRERLWFFFDQQAAVKMAAVNVMNSFKWIIIIIHLLPKIKSFIVAGEKWLGFSLYRQINPTIFDVLIGGFLIDSLPRWSV